MAIGVVLARCAPAPAPVVAPPPAALPPHAGPPPAAVCKVKPFHVPDGGIAEVQMTVGNDGGYCAATLTAANGQPFSAPLVMAEPQHGTPRVVKYNGKTSVEYTPASGFVGHDQFAVQLIRRGLPGYTSLNVSVTVEPRS